MNDKELISACKRNRPKAQRMLLDKYSNALMSTGMRYTKNSSLVMDALQETWIIIFNKIQQYEEKGYFLPWAKKILIREVLKMKTKEKNNIVFLQELRTSSNHQNPVAEQKLELEEILLLVDQLSSPTKEIFKMYVIDGLKHKEIAEIFEIKESTSRVYVTNARKFLNQRLMIISRRKVKA